MQTEACDEMAAHVNAICRGGTSEKPVVAGVISDSVIVLNSGKEYHSQAGAGRGGFDQQPVAMKVKMAFMAFIFKDASLVSA